MAWINHVAHQPLPFINSPSATMNPSIGIRKDQAEHPNQCGSEYEQNIPGTNYIVGRKYTLLQCLYFILYCQNGETCWVFASVIGEEQMVKAQLEVIQPLK